MQGAAMKKYRKSLSVKGFPLQGTLLFDLAFGVDSHLGGIATLHAHLEVEEPQDWEGYGVTPPVLDFEPDFEINAADTHELIQKFLRNVEKNVQGELDKLSPLAGIGSDFVQGVEAVFSAGKYLEA
jgi:hypothetical protein